MEKAGERAHPDLTLPAEFPETLPEYFDGNESGRKDEEGDDRQFPVQVENVTDEADDGKDILEKTGDSIRYRCLDEIDVIGDPGDQNARRCFCKKRKGKVLEMAIELLPHIGDDPQAHKVHQIRLAVIKNPFEKENEDESDGKEQEHLFILVYKYLVDNVFHEIGLGGVEERIESHTDRGENNLGPVGFHQSQQSQLYR